MSDNLPQDHPQVLPPKPGVLLLNLGTPDATDYWSMRRYLSEFLGDKRVIEVPRIIWWFVLNLIILTFRPKRSGKKYDTIWDNEANDSPLRVIAAAQAKSLQKRLGDDVVVDFAMRYGNPTTKSRIEAMQSAGCDRIVLLPLYPQYSATTTATANDKAFDALKTMRWQPAVRTAPAYADDPAYISAIAQSIEEGIGALDFEPDMVVTSYHGMPVAYLERGDPYHCQCLKTTRLLREKLGWDADKLMATFQSRFGGDEWLQPYTDETLAALPGRGVKKIAVLTPGFSVDCLETLEEIAMEGKEDFLNSGGTHYAYIPCLNAEPLGMDLIEHLARKELVGWI